MAAKKKTKTTKKVGAATGSRFPITRGTRPKRSTPPASAPTPSEESRKIALAAAAAGLDKKALAVEIIDVSGKIDYADFLVLMSGQSDRHVAAIADSVDGLLAKQGYRSHSVEGLPKAEWVLIDFVDVVVHVFHEHSRSLYDLDGLWMDATRVPVPEQARDPQPVAAARR